MLRGAKQSGGDSTAASSIDVVILERSEESDTLDPDAMPNPFTRCGVWVRKGLSRPATPGGRGFFAALKNDR